MAEPRIVTRPEQPYVGIRAAVTLRPIGRVADRIGELIGWLAARGEAPAGAPFLRYWVIDMERRLDVEAGVPTASRSTARATSPPARSPPAATRVPATTATPTS